MDDSDYLRLLTIQAEQANAFLSNARKWERERWVCQRLLQGLNIPYRADEFTPAGQEPPDVLFREACFEVFFVLDEGRRLNDEWRDELQRRRSAFSLSQLVRREAKPKRIPANELLLRLAPTLRKKAHNYKERGMDLGSWTSSPSPASSAKCSTSTAISRRRPSICARVGARCRWSDRPSPAYCSPIPTRRTSCAATWGAASSSTSGSACRSFSEGFSGPPSDRCGMAQTPCECYKAQSPAR